MGWNIPWYTITDDFDVDFGVDEWHGTTSLLEDAEHVFRTYFTNNRGDETMGSTWSYLDITPLGRQEEWEDSPEGYPKSEPYTWWNWHDNYSADADPKWNSVVETAQAMGRFCWQRRKYRLAAPPLQSSPASVPCCMRSRHTAGTLSLGATGFRAVRGEYGRNNVRRCRSGLSSASTTRLRPQRG